MNLDEAIAQLIELGEKDAIEIARKIEAQQGRDWLVEELVAHAEDIIVARANRLLDAQRRHAIVAVRPNQGMKKAELGLKMLYVPNLLGNGVGARKPVNECTPDDFEAAATYREHIVRSVMLHANWMREVAARMRHEGADTFAEFKGEVPSLPELEAA